MERFEGLWRRNRSTLGNGPGRGVRVVLGWDVPHDSVRDQAEAWDAPFQSNDPRYLRAAKKPSGFGSRRQVGSTALAPSTSRRSAAFLDDEFDPRRLVTHPVTVLDLARNGIHLIVGAKPERDRDHWIGIEEGSSFVWSKVVLRSLSEPSLGTFLARYSFVGACPYELIRRAILGRPAESGREKEPNRS
ncbi:MAG: hypothetical protein P4L85_22790 [Paludisphaera borealis]|uniref:hypothetical protein n=1 Tax=Paludisphaera borealis TaxID=1387353 RepID=UPI0028431642|nr:hypothetical protein [Paludisphaera borealis]MDR3622195.1 hypothetical protein [Paludisphaera borealis]